MLLDINMPNANQAKNMRFDDDLKRHISLYSVYGVPSEVPI